MSLPSPAAGDCAPFGHLTQHEQRLLAEIQRQSLGYFLENQLPHGLVLDRQHNHGSPGRHGLCSTAATGMGLVAIALASAPEYAMLSTREACARVRTCLETALDRLPGDHGMMPHFVDADTLQPIGSDRISTIDSSWLVAGGLWAGAFLQDSELQALAWRLYRRIDWRYWSKPNRDRSAEILVHGKDREDNFLPFGWDRLNAETAFLYVLAVGAEPEQSLAPACWRGLESFPGVVAGLRFPSADLGLFVFQYSMELLDFQEYQVPHALDLFAEASIATLANYEACRSEEGRYRTYRNFWGLSAGDGPGDPGQEDAYRCYAPGTEVDGTAHLTATLASISTWPELVLRNVHAAEQEAGVRLRGRHGYSNVNLDRGWLSRDVVGIDLGAAVLALDNFMHHGRVRQVFHGLDCVRQGLERLGAGQQVPSRQAS